MTVQEVETKVRKRAGIRNEWVKVLYLDHQRSIPPSIRRIRRGLGRGNRVVVVSCTWLRNREPVWWSVLMVGRLLQDPDDENKITFIPLKEADRYDPNG